jgi:hypothetical protein
MRLFIQVSCLVIAGILAGCGSVSAKADANGGGDGSGSGSACTTNDQCAAPTPVCDPGNGCVGCLENSQCTAAQPTCDTTTHACRACAIDADCDSAVCDVATGMCVAEANVLYVSPTGGDTGTCPKTQPCSIAQAAAVADAIRNNIKLAPGSYSAHVVLTNKTLIFYAFGATIAGGANPVFEVDDGARLRVNGGTLTGATGLSVIRCEGAAAATHVLELFRTTLDNTSTSMLANPCTVTVEESVLRTTNTTSYAVLLVAPTVAKFNRTRFVGGGNGIASLSNATVQITNSVFKKMGDAANHGVFVGGGFDVSFATIIDSVVECSTSGATGLTLDSSIVNWASSGAPADTMIGIPSCTSVKYSVIFPMSQPVGSTNVSMAPGFKNVSGDDYHLLATSPAIDRGDPAATNAIDFDGVSRPQGAQRDSGAFEFKP